MKILVLDFDGVMADSRLECFFVGYNAYLKMNPRTRLLDGKKLTFANFNDGINTNKKTIDEYKKLRPYVTDAFCWYVMLHIIENEIPIKNQQQYNKLRGKLMKNYYKYIRLFYKERRKQQINNFNKWIVLIRPLEKIINSIKKLQKQYVVCIATNNRKKSLEPFLRKYGIKPKIIADSLISTDKLMQIKHIKDKLKLSFSQVYFVDDQVLHFPKLLKLGVHCYLATWGYNNEKQRGEAAKNGAVLLAQNNFYGELK